MMEDQTEDPSATLLLAREGLARRRFDEVLLRLAPLVADTSPAPGFEAVLAEAWGLTGMALAGLNRAQEAEAALRLAITLAPEHGAFRHNLGQLLLARGRLAAAAAELAAAAPLCPGNAGLRAQLARALLQLGAPERAAEAAEAALAIQPGLRRAWRILAHARLAQKALPEAAAAFAVLAEHAPSDWPALGRAVQISRGLCDWSAPALAREERLLAAARSGRLGAEIMPVLFTLALEPEEQKAVANRWAEGLQADLPPPPPWNVEAAPQRLRLGYLSGDFHEHATAYLTAELFEAHDRSRFEVHAYSYGPDDHGPMRRRLRAAFDRFTDLAGLDDAAAAARIRADGVHILIDLKGYTGDARPGIVARRPAPLQLSWLGWPGTMGAGFIDAILGDCVVIPQGLEAAFGEAVVRLPGCYQANDSTRPLAPPPSRAACGLPETGFVFCCFNQPYKITPEVFGLWMRLLRQVPGSVLWLLSDDDAVRRNLAAAAQGHKVAPERLVFAPPVSNAAHLARQAVADLFLDTFPVTAHTTASDALWAGLPLLTRQGRTFTARVASSLLTTLGLGELIAHSEAEYEAKALTLARQPEALADLRGRLGTARGASGLFDGRRFAAKLETALCDLWAAQRS